MKETNTPIFVIRKSVDKKEYMRFKDGQLIWVSDPFIANPYPSKYAGKKHMQRIEGLPDSVVMCKIR